MKKELRLLPFILFLVVVHLNAQSGYIRRPITSGASGVDRFVGNIFDAYEESIRISEAIEFIKIQITEVPDMGDGVTTEMIISTGNGKQLTPENAIKQLLVLLVRVKDQKRHVESIKRSASSVESSFSRAHFITKIAAGAAFVKGLKAATATIKECGKQGRLINQQISLIRAYKNN